MHEAIAIIGTWLLLAGGVLWVRPPRRPAPPAAWLEEARTDRVIVHTTDGSSIEGTIRETAPDGVVLAAARLLDHDVDVAGDLWIPAPKVAMVQRPTRGG